MIFGVEKFVGIGGLALDAEEDIESDGACGGDGHAVIVRNG